MRFLRQDHFGKSTSTPQYKWNLKLQSNISGHFPNKIQFKLGKKSNLIFWPNLPVSLELVFFRRGQFYLITNHYQFGFQCLKINISMIQLDHKENVRSSDTIPIIIIIARVTYKFSSVFLFW